MMTMLVLVSTVYSVEAGNIGVAVIDTEQTLQGISITILSPDGGENWLRDTDHTIRWTSSGSHRSNVKVELYKAGTLSRTISVSSSNDGSKNWKIPSTQALGTDYKVKITNLSNMGDYDFSDANFTISSPSITVVSPNGGNNWERRHTYTISWNHIGDTGSRVKIELFRGNKLSRKISSSTPNDGSYRWTVPSSQTLDNNYRIKVTSRSHSEYYDWSNGYFTIS